VWTARSAGERGRARHGMSAGVSRGPRTELAGGCARAGAARQRVGHGLTESTSRLRIRSNARTLMT
jgi:hypothetical protein